MSGKSYVRDAFVSVSPGGGGGANGVFVLRPPSTCIILSYKCNFEKKARHSPHRGLIILYDRFFGKTMPSKALLYRKHIIGTFYVIYFTTLNSICNKFLVLKLVKIGEKRNVL